MERTQSPSLSHEQQSWIHSLPVYPEDCVNRWCSSHPSCEPWFGQTRLVLNTRDVLPPEKGHSVPAPGALWQQTVRCEGPLSDYMGQDHSDPVRYSCCQRTCDTVRAADRLPLKTVMMWWKGRGNVAEWTFRSRNGCCMIGFAHRARPAWAGRAGQQAYVQSSSQSKTSGALWKLNTLPHSQK